MTQQCILQDLSSESVYFFSILFSFKSCSKILSTLSLSVSLIFLHTAQGIMECGFTPLISEFGQNAAEGQ